MFSREVSRKKKVSNNSLFCRNRRATQKRSTMLPEKKTDCLTTKNIFPSCRSPFMMLHFVFHRMNFSVSASLWCSLFFRPYVCHGILFYPHQATHLRAHVRIFICKTKNGAGRENRLRRRRRRRCEREKPMWRRNVAWNMRTWFVKWCAKCISVDMCWSLVRVWRKSCRWSHTEDVETLKCERYMTILWTWAKLLHA